MCRFGIRCKFILSWSLTKTCMYIIQKWCRGQTPKKVWNFDGINIKILKENDVFWTKALHSLEVQIDSILSYLLDLFKTPIKNVFHYDNSMYAVIPSIRKCDKFESKYRKMENDQMNSFLRNMPIASKQLILNITVDNEFQCDSDLNIRFSSDYLIIDNGTWITREMFLSLNCAYIELSNCRFTPEVYVDFVRNWYNSDSTRLEFLEVRYVHEIFTASMFDEFKPTKWDAKQRNKEFRTTSKLIDCENGLDIVRIDGLRATIVSNYYLFVFAVWHRPFDNRPVIPTKVPLPLPVRKRIRR